MPSKYRIILEMASQTARDIASNADRYTDFLITAANNYKYSFKEQLLIHAQKPDATACAEIDTWNKLGRWVNKGTKGIALLIDRDVPYKLRHVFDEGKNREIVFGKFEACSEDDSIIFMECNEKVSKELKKDCHRKQYIRSRDAETPFQIMSYSTMTFQESEIYGEDVLEDTECNVEESVMQRMDIERVRTALKMLAPEERAIIQDFFFTESPIPVKELVEKYAMPKTSIYRKRDDALKKLKKILGNA